MLFEVKDIFSYDLTDEELNKIIERAEARLRFPIESGLTIQEAAIEDKSLDELG